MGQALKVIQFDSDENQSNEQLDGKNPNSFIYSAFGPIRIAAITTAILGIISLVLEVHSYFQFRYEIYLARLIPTIVSLITVTLLISNFGKKNYKIITHIYFFTILASLGFVSYKLPSMFGYSLMGASLFHLILSLFVKWGRQNQIAAVVYFILIFGIAALLADSYALAAQNIETLIPTAIIILIISLASNILTFKEKPAQNVLVEPLPETESEVLNVEKEFFNNSVVPLFKCELEGKMEFINGACKELLNLTEDTESVEINLFDDIIKNEKVKKHFLKKMENKGKVEAYRFKYEDRNEGEEIFVMDCKLSHENKIKFIEGSIRNITKQYKTDKALRQELETLQQSKRPSSNIIPSIENRESEKTNVISQMGHELRTPMNSVLGFLTLIENGLFENEDELKEFSHSAKLSAESLLGLLNDVVEIAKIQDGVIEVENSEFDLKEEIDRLSQEIIPHLEQKELELQTDVDQDIPDLIITDKSKYLQIITNLLRNAINVSESGQISLTIKHNNSKDGMKLISIIEDSSEGMEESDLEKLMNNGFDKKEKNAKITSSLLHVMISKELINLLDGKISAESEVGKGTKFKLELEIKSGQTQVVEKDDVDHVFEADNSSKSRLLLVEDNPISRKVEQKLLQEAGYNVDSVDSAAKAIELVSKNLYDLILMDIELKDMNGLDATKAIRELPDGLNNIPIIAVTAHSSMKDREKCLVAGMNDYISKPINITFLKMTIDQCIKSARSNS